MGNPRRQRISIKSNKGKPPMGKTVDRSPFKDSEVETQYIPALHSYIHNDRGKKYQVVEQIDAKSFIVRREKTAPSEMTRVSIGVNSCTPLQGAEAVIERPAMQPSKNMMPA